MDVIELKQKLEEAFGASTKSYNRFKEFVISLGWDCSFYADGEYYFVKDDITFTTPSLNPFEVMHSWDMCLMTSDGSMLKVSKSF